MKVVLGFDEFVRLLGTVGVGFLWCCFENGGRVIHSNPALQRLLREEPARATLEEDLERMLANVQAAIEAEGGIVARRAVPLVEWDVQTEGATYRLCGFRIPAHAELTEIPMALITIEQLRLDPLHRERLHRRFRLTHREAELTRLLVKGKTNTEVAEALAISPNTAHHYTERVLLKLGVRNRTEIGAKLLYS